jgi:hypothetical protein
MIQKIRSVRTRSRATSYGKENISSIYHENRSLVYDHVLLLRSPVRGSTRSVIMSLTNEVADIVIKQDVVRVTGRHGARRG